MTITGGTRRLVIDETRDQTPRHRPGERLPHLVTELAGEHPDRVVVDTGDTRWTAARLVAQARRTARLLRARGVGPGDRVAILVDEPVASYVAMLAVGLVHAAYVPLDAGFPADRIGFICDDAGAGAALVAPALAERLPAAVATIDPVDAADHDDAPLRDDETGAPTDELAYLIYTSGTTGRPKGVAIEHAAIVNFVRVAAEVYGLEPGYRVYQGMTIAFDFSVEEIWVPWLSGATLVPKPAGTTLLGDDLTAFLRERDVTGIACVPTLLATLDEQQLDRLRFVLVSGEACPQDLVVRWHRDDRRFLNVYGPTEATVTATWTPLHPDRPVTLGRPLPTYSVVVLDPEGEDLRPDGEPGEIAIGGPGLARGYLGRPEKTAAAFVDHALGRLYRTGDLGTVTPDGEIAYHGRIDTQVKIRGYRIELTEIESVALAEPGVAAAVVDTWESGPGTTELVGYFSLRPGQDPDAVRSRLRDRLRDRLPGYMVPPFLEHLDAIPLTTSDKVDRAALPAPRGPRSAPAGDHTDPVTDTERALVAALAPVLGAETVSSTADLFDELGASSLLLARFTTAARAEGLSLSMRALYEHRTLVALGAALDAVPDDGSAPVAPPRPVREASALAMALTGVGQLLAAALYVVGLTLALEWAYGLVGAGVADGAAAGDLAALGTAVLRALVVGALGFALLALAPIAVKWLLVGRWRETEIPVWTWRYLRFWIVKTLVRSNLVVLLFAGTPVYTLYLRALGARIGRRTVVLTTRVPICTDLVSIGADTVIRKDVWMQGYAAEGGVLRTGRVEIGDRSFVGEAAVLDVDTRIGDDAQLAHASSLAAGARVPDGGRWHGVPGRPGPDVDYRRAGETALPGWRRVSFGVLQALQVLVVVVPLAVLLLEGAIGLGVGSDALPAIGSAGFVADAALIAALSFFGITLLGLLAAITLPRLVRRLLVPGRTYPLYGVRYSLLRATALLSNRAMLVTLFGDSSAVTTYQRLLGWDLGRVEQTGSNFGTTHKHDSPFAARVGRGTMISDGLSMANAEYSSTGFRVMPAAIGDRNFLGNLVVYPAGGRTGDDVLLATKVMVPLDGDVHAGTGLLGSPAFRIPRSVQRDPAGADAERPSESALRDERLGAKNRHNAATMLLMLLARFGETFVLTLVGLAAAVLYPTVGLLAVAAAAALAPLIGVLWFVLVERAALGFRRLRPRTCSIYDPYFWRHERLWKLLVPPLAVLDGTPFKPMMLRLLGVRVGKRLFDDGSRMPEHTLVSLGDHVTLGAGTTIQCHSLEDGAFASDRTVLGDRTTVGTSGFVHYGVHVGAGAVVDPDAFVMKGTELPPATRWRGNPAAQA